MTRGGIGDLLPQTVRQYSRSPSFDSKSVPESLTKHHATKVGVWARINVESGSLTYIITGDPDRIFHLDPSLPGVIAPEEVHHVTLRSPATRFHVAFYK